VFDFDIGTAEFGGVAAFDDAALLEAQRLLAVADGEDRHARLEHRLGRAGAALAGHRVGAAGEDDALRLQLREGGLGRLIGMDLAVDAGLANATGDQLGDLGAEVDDENGVVQHGGLRGRKRSEVS